MRPIVAVFALALLATPALAQGRITVAQLSPAGDLLSSFDLRCQDTRCTGVAEVDGPDGPLFLRGIARLYANHAELMFHAPGARIASDGPLYVSLENGRTVRNVELVREWRETESLSLRRPAPAGILLRVAIGP